MDPSCGNWYAAYQLCGAIKFLFLQGVWQSLAAVSPLRSILHHSYQHVLSWQDVLLRELR